MFKKIGMLIVVSMLFAGCTSVPMEGAGKNLAAKQFNPPKEGNAGLYIYRNSFVGQALKKDVWVDGKCIGETAPDVFFYEEVEGDKDHKISTESEFSPNDLTINTKSGMHYFIRQYIKIGVFVGGAGVELVDMEQGKKDVSGLNMAIKGACSNVNVSSVNVKETPVTGNLAPMERPAFMTTGSTWISQDMDTKNIEKTIFIERKGLLATSQNENGCIQTRDYAQPFSEIVKWENCTNPDGINVNTKLDDNQIWPLKVGNNWTYRQIGRNAGGRDWNTVRKCEVEGQVNVTTQLGIFDTFKVVCADKWKVLTWYIAPEFKQTVLYTNYNKNKKITKIFETVDFSVK